MKIACLAALAALIAVPAVAQEREYRLEDVGSKAPVQRAEGFSRAEELNQAQSAAASTAEAQYIAAQAQWRRQESEKTRDYNLALARHNQALQAYERQMRQAEGGSVAPSNAQAAR